MRRFSIYAFGLSAGIVGLFAALFAGSEWLYLQKPQLTYFTVAAAIVFAIGGVAISALMPKAAKRWQLVALCSTGLSVFVVTQVFFWAAVIH
jgi:hypothetical protein